MNITDTIVLSNGVLMPRIGLGTYKTAEGQEVTRAVMAAIEVGVRSIDTASLYGNEAGIGRGVRDSGVSRADVFITTKVWNDDQGYDKTRASIHHSLGLLESDYIDMLLIHWPIVESMEGTWRAMEDALADGLVRAIGVSNFLPHHLDELAKSAQIQPMVNQLEFHPRLQQPEVMADCIARGIVIESWRPMMRGTVGSIAEIAEIAEHHDKTAAQVTIRWVLQRGFIVIPKSARPERIRENIDVFDFELSLAEMAVMDSLDRGERLGHDPDNFSF